MKWHSPIPRNMDTRVSRRFALLPVQIGSDLVWLERYWLKEKYVYRGCDTEWIEDDITQDKSEANEWKMDIEIMQQGRES